MRGSRAGPTVGRTLVTRPKEATMGTFDFARRSHRGADDGIDRRAQRRRQADRRPPARPGLPSWCPQGVNRRPGTGERQPRHPHQLPAPRRRARTASSRSTARHRRGGDALHARPRCGRGLRGEEPGAGTASRRPADDSMPRYVIERTLAESLRIPIDAKGANGVLGVVRRNADEGVAWLSSYVSKDRRRTFCIYGAPSPEAVRATAARTRFRLTGSRRCACSTRTSTGERRGVRCADRGFGG